MNNPKKLNERHVIAIQRGYHMTSRENTLLSYHHYVLLLFYQILSFDVIMANINNYEIANKMNP